MLCTTQATVSHGWGHNTSFLWSVSEKRNNHDVIPISTVFLFYMVDLYAVTEGVISSLCYWDWLCWSIRTYTVTYVSFTTQDTAGKDQRLQNTIDVAWNTGGGCVCRKNISASAEFFNCWQESPNTGSIVSPQPGQITLIFTALVHSTGWNTLLLSLWQACYRL